jgi:hypothetical protein
MWSLQGFAEEEDAEIQNDLFGESRAIAETTSV